MSHVGAQGGRPSEAQRAGSCTGKFAFASAVHAHRAARRRRRRHVYRCRYCGFWHCGERSVKPKRNPRRERR